jgi:hypothetical protein
MKARASNPNKTILRLGRASMVEHLPSKPKDCPKQQKQNKTKKTPVMPQTAKAKQNKKE